MKALLLLALICPMSSVAATMSCDQVKAIAERCKAANQPADASHAELERALSGYFACVEAATGLSFREANRKYAHCGKQ